jgi:hypothetical protein
MPETKNKIYESMIGIISDVQFIGKDNKADMGNAGKYNFRGIDDMYNALHPLFVKHEVFLIPKVLEATMETQVKEKVWNGQTTKSLQYSTTVKMEFTFVAIDGSSITATGIGHALDTSDKGTNKAQSSALKYCLMQTFLIPTEEDKDVEKENNQIAEAEKLKKLKEFKEKLEKIASEIIEKLEKENIDKAQKWFDVNVKNLNAETVEKYIQKRETVK